MRPLRYALLSEFGIDQGLNKGRFNSLADDSHGEFNSYWWKETCQFEDHLIKEFPEDAVFVSSQVPPYREFGIWPEDRPPLDNLCEMSLAYLERFHPDASVTMASPLGHKQGCGRIVLTLHGAWMDQDLAEWFLEKSREKGLSFPGLEDVRKELDSVEIVHALPWLSNLAPVRAKSREFWKIVYWGSELLPIGRTDEEKAEGYKLGYEIVGRLRDRHLSLNGGESQAISVSLSLPKQRIIKVECTRKLCDQEFAENIFRIVTGIDGAWAVRLAVFEDLTEDNSYLGGVIIKPDGQFVAEVA